MSCSTARVLTTLLFTLAMGSSASAWADACATGTSSFTDVPDTASFCTNTQWLKNRAVTIGCGAGTTFCPSDTVIRSSMALFMNRLGTALTPLFEHAVGNSSALTVSNSGLAVCASDIVPAVNYPRTGTISGWVSGANPTADMTLTVAGVLSLQSNPFLTSGQYATATLPTSTSTSVPASGEWLIPAGQTAQFAIYLYQSGALPTAKLGTMTCDMVAQVVNFNSTTAPF